LKEILTINSEFKAILDELENADNHLFITGKAGTGKSTLLHLFRSATSRNLVVLAPTGVSALHVKGQTIHSFFRLPPKLIHSHELDIKKGMGKLLKSLEIIIIDEISMVRAEILDHIDHLLKFYRKNDSPFGGVRMIFFGDLFQLPPVLATDAEKYFFSHVYKTPYFFSANVFNNGFQLYLIELTTVFRQKDQVFKSILNKIRKNEIDEDLIRELNKQYKPEIESQQGCIYLTATNRLADRINEKHLEGIDQEEHIYTSVISGNFQMNILPGEQTLRLKVGAQVMFLKNDPDGLYVNGTIGTVTKLQKDEIYVLPENQSNDTPIKLTRAEWDMIRYKPGDNGSIQSEVLGTFRQFPVRLAWAVTIHKSQGKTFEKVILDLGRGAFEHGQTYVALSRCTSLDNLFLKKPITERDFIIDERIIEFYDSIR
jgi:ATP-dependent DNA helicase PIF1